MPDPRKPDPIEQTLLPENMTAPPSVAQTLIPTDTAAQEAALKPQSSAIPTLRPVPQSAITEADVTRAPLSGFNASAAPAVDGTQVLPGSRTGVPDKTIGNDLQPSPPPSSAATGTQVGRFALRGLHARGGLGEVFTARDTELNREVAVKRIQSRYADDPSSRRRFLTEAEITARLDHPGVVPVFGLVADGFGRPCYAMRFIRGETLKDEIERYHGAVSDTAKTDSATHEGKPAEPKSEVQGLPRSVAFRHLLQRFIAVCQAIAYAHTRNVIHRDIKPANVMVGTFGETLVVDWGLAKALDDGPDPEMLLKAASNAGFRRDPDATELPDHLTLAGTAVGTPAYMSPEQASGRLEIIGPAADVYSLGATLFAILTGKAPFSGTATETLDKVRRGDFPTPSSLNPELPASLDAVCRKAMSLRIEDRYKTPLELASDVERWLSDEPVSCYRDPLAARLARWARRHPARVATAVSLLVAGVLAAAGTSWAVMAEKKNTEDALKLMTDARNDKEREMKRAQDAEAETNIALDKLREQKKETDRQFDEAQTARDSAKKRYDGAVKAFNTLVVGIQKQLADRIGTQDLRENLLKKAKEGLNELIEESKKDKQGKAKIEADRTLIAAYRQLGDVYLLLGNTRDAQLQYQEAVDKAVKLFFLIGQHQLIEDEWVAREEWGLSSIRLANAQLQAGKTESARGSCQSALEMFQAIVKHTPNDLRALENLAAALDQFGDVLIERGETAAADKQCNAALDIRQKLLTAAKNDPDVQRGLPDAQRGLADAQRRLADSKDQYAEILLRSGKSDEARKIAGETLDIRIAIDKELPNHPDVTRELAGAHSRLGEILFDRDNLADARQQFEAALKVLNDYLVRDHRSAGAKSAQAVTHGWLSAVSLRSGDLPTALREATESVELSILVDKADHDSTRTTRDLAKSYERLGDVRLARGSISDALDSYRKSVGYLETIANNDPDSALAKMALAHALERLGTGELAKKDSAAALISLNRSVAIRKEVLNIDTASAQAKRDLAVGLGQLAEAQQAAKKYALARESITREMTLLREVVDANKENRPARRELALAAAKWGEALVEEGDNTLALIAVSQAVDQFRALVTENKGNDRALAELAEALDRQAGVYARIGQGETAIRTANEALDIRTELANAQKDTKAALRERAIAMIRLADTHFSINEFDRAQVSYERACALLVPDPSDALTTATATMAGEKLALLIAVKALWKDPVNGLEGVDKNLRITALKSAAESLLKGNKIVSASTLAWKLSSTATSPEDRYEGAEILARCAKASKPESSAREGYLDDAIGALKLAVAVDFRNVELLKGPEWDLCRKRADFQKVLESISVAKPLFPSPKPVPMGK